MTSQPDRPLSTWLESASPAAGDYRPRPQTTVTDLDGKVTICNFTSLQTGSDEGALQEVEIKGGRSFSDRGSLEKFMKRFC